MFGNHTLRAILQEIKTMSTALSDLQTSVANLTTITTSAVALLNQLAADLKAGNPISAADIETQVTAINAQVASLSAAVTADAPAPAPAPAA
jgi:ABC-type transporter Mla MlaB component